MNKYHESSEVKRECGRRKGKGEMKDGGGGK